MTTPDQAPFRSRHCISLDLWFDFEVVSTEGDVTVYQRVCIGEGEEGMRKARRWDAERAGE